MTEQKDIQRQLGLLKARYATNLGSRLAGVIADLDSFQTQADPDTTLAGILRQIHSLTGSAGTFGFSRISEHARQLELTLKQHVSDHTLPDTRTIDHLRHGLDKLVQLASNGSDDSQVDSQDDNIRITPAAPVASTQRLVHVVDPDPVTALQLSHQLEQQGFSVRVFSSTTQACQDSAQATPDALIIDTALQTQQQAEKDFAPLLRTAQATPVPGIFMTSANDWTSRLAAVRAGGCACIDKPVDFALLLTHLERVTRKTQAEPCRILVVDDCDELAQHYALVLRDAGMHTEMLTEPAEILERMQSFSPELVLLDYYFPGISGLEIARVLRQHDTWLCTPIVFLSTELEVDIQLKTLQQGDDFLEKPILDAHLVSAVTARIERARALRKLMHNDMLTGLLSKLTLQQRLETERARCSRQNHPLCYIMLDLDNFKQLNDKHGYAAGDRVLISLAHMLSHRLRKSDHVGRISGEEFGIIMPATDAITARGIFEMLADAFCQLAYPGQTAEFNCSFSASIVCTTSVSDDASLAEVAASALQRVRHNGPNQVVVYE